MQILVVSDRRSSCTKLCPIPKHSTIGLNFLTLGHPSSSFVLNSFTDSSGCFLLRIFGMLHVRICSLRSEHTKYDISLNKRYNVILRLR